jgi:hypothetical protein
MEAALQAPDGRRWVVRRRWVTRLAARIIFGRPWTIEARADDGTIYTWRVTGWRASTTRQTEIRRQLATGHVPPP